MNRPAADRQADRVKTAAQVIGQRTLIERIEQVTVGYADGDRDNHQPGKEAEMSPGIGDDNRRRWRSTTVEPALVGVRRHAGPRHRRVWLPGALIDARVIPDPAPPSIIGLPFRCEL